MNKWLNQRRRSAYLVALAGTILTVSIVVYPQEAFSASTHGLRLWWEIVFPALLPFFIATEILMGLGVVHFTGVLLEPLMQPIFRVPGVGGFAVAMGLASGYPIGAKITASLRRDNLCSRLEAERLVSFSNMADPAFMLGAVAVGMFSNLKLGAAIAQAHYLSSILLGLLMRFYGGHEKVLSPTPASHENILDKALRDLYRARVADGRSIGQLMGDSVREAVNTLLMIGGFIITFSVLIRIMTVTGLAGLFGRPAASILGLFGFSHAAIAPVFSGIFEITLGTDLASQAAVPLVQKAMLASAIIAWSGLSVHAQVASMISDTDIRFWPYFLARLIHAMLAALITPFFLGATTVSSGISSLPPFQAYITPQPGFWAHFTTAVLILMGALTIMILLSLASFLARRIQVVVLRVKRP
ncbi:MAG: sporulation integral membrane protein YlbJ [Syntrophothermus sp.]